MGKKKGEELTVSDIIKRRRYQYAVSAGYRDLLIRLILIGVTILVLLTQVFLLMRNTGMDMFPSVKDGDLVLAYRLEQDYAKDDVIVYEDDGKLLIGRVAAMAGDIVTIDESGTVLVNGTPQTSEIIYPTYAKDGLTYPYTVPEGKVFLLGDYRTQAVDSRDSGAVDLKDVKGKVITILRRRGL